MTDVETEAVLLCSGGTEKTGCGKDAEFVVSGQGACSKHLGQITERVLDSAEKAYVIRAVG